MALHIKSVKTLEDLIKACANVKVLHRLIALKDDEPNLYYGDDYHLSPYSFFKQDDLYFACYKVRSPHYIAMQKLKPDINMTLKESVGRNNHKIKFTIDEDIDEEAIYTEMFEKFCEKNKIQLIDNWKEKIDKEEEKIGEKIGIDIKELKNKEQEMKQNQKKINHAPDNVPDDLSCKGGCGFYSLPESDFCSVCVKK